IWRRHQEDRHVKQPSYKYQNTCRSRCFPCRARNQCRTCCHKPSPLYCKIHDLKLACSSKCQPTKPFFSSVACASVFVGSSLSHLTSMSFLSISIYMMSSIMEGFRFLWETAKGLRMPFMPG